MLVAMQQAQRAEIGRFKILSTMIRIRLQNEFIASRVNAMTVGHVDTLVVKFASNFWTVCSLYKYIFSNTSRWVAMVKITRSQSHCKWKEHHHCLHSVSPKPGKRRRATLIIFVMAVSLSTNTWLQMWRRADLLLVGYLLNWSEIDLVESQKLCQICLYTWND